MAATVGVVTAALPYFSRWLQLCLETAIGLLAVTAVVNGSGVPVAVLASLAVGWGVTALVHLVFGSPLGLPSTGEVELLLGDLDITAVGVSPAADRSGASAGSTARSTASGWTCRCTGGTPRMPSCWPRRSASSSTATRGPPWP